MVIHLTCPKERNGEDERVALDWTSAGKRKRGRLRETCRRTAEKESEERDEVAELENSGESCQGQAKVARPVPRLKLLEEQRG